MLRRGRRCAEVTVEPVPGRDGVGKEGLAEGCGRSYSIAPGKRGAPLWQMLRCVRRANTLSLRGFGMGSF